MDITVLGHYPLSAGLSMRAYASLLQQTLEARGHRVRCETAPVLLGRLGWMPGLRKWLGYVDCLVLFPLLFRWRQLGMGRSDLYVLSDQALGPWLPLLGCHPHVIHCHDFLALQAAMGAGPAPPLGPQTGWTGRRYQQLIRWGFRQGRCFVSVSATTRAQLHAQLEQAPLLSAVAANPIPTRFAPLPGEQSRSLLQPLLDDVLEAPFLLHVGRGWYKNRLGVLQIWEQLRHQAQASPLPQLVLVGRLEPTLRQWLAQRPELGPELLVLERVSDEQVVALYNRAAVLLFPSLAEGFGWPVLEALACGCAVVTTAAPPMSTVGGPWVHTIPVAPPLAGAQDAVRQQWVVEAAEVVQTVLNRPPAQRDAERQGGLNWAARFTAAAWGQQLEAFYRQAQHLQQQEVQR